MKMHGSFQPEKRADWSDCRDEWLAIVAEAAMGDELPRVPILGFSLDDSWPKDEATRPDFAKRLECAALPALSRWKGGRPKSGSKLKHQMLRAIRACIPSGR
jgi:hypothetical protein